MPTKPEQLPPDQATLLERFKGVFFAQWEELLRLRRAVLKTSGLDDIHDLRVASRRFRAALDLFDPISPKSTKTELKKSVRKLTRNLGSLRNIDEALLFFQSRCQADASVDNKLREMLSKLRSGELKRIKKALTAFDHHNYDRMVREMVAGLNEDCIKERESFSLLAYFSDVSIRRYMAIQQLLAVSTAPGHRELRHALRIAIKKWRYFLETVAPVLDCDYTPVLGLLKDYQSILGGMNDVVEFEVLISNLDLSQDERGYVEATLLKEDTLLLGNLTELIESKPLSYTFLV